MEYEEIGNKFFKKFRKEKKNYFYKVGVIQNSASIYQIISLMRTNFYGILNGFPEQSMNYNLAANNKFLNNLLIRRPAG